MAIKHLFIKILKKTKVLRHLNFVFTFTINQSKVKIPVIKGLGYPNAFLETNWLYALIESFCSNDGAFLDVGVNIGQTLIALKTTNKSIHYIGFEPNISCLFYLNELITINKYQDCQIFSLALSDKLQQLRLEKNEDTDAAGSVIHNLRPDYFNKSESILGINFDGLLLNQKISFIKIDVEGAELEVLMGMKNMLLHNRPFITCEVLDSFSIDVLEFTQKRADMVCDFLNDINYSIIQLEQNEIHNRIISVKNIKCISIKLWTKDSYRFNDYLFVPNEIRLKVFKMFESN